MQNQFSQERRNIHHETFLRELFAKPRQKIQRPHRNRPRHRHRVRRIRRNPHRPQRRHHPHALLRAQSHHPARSKQQLVLRMRMLRNHMPMSQVRRYASHLAKKSAVRRKEYALALVRHFLSQYRENLATASAIPITRNGPRRGASGGKQCWHQQRWSALSPRRTTAKRAPSTKVSLDQFALVMTVGGYMIRIVKIPNFTPLQGTILGWQVENIQSVAIWLRDSGVPPEKYSFVQDQNLGIWTTPDGSKVAWFKDPDGNILSVSQHTP